MDDSENITSSFNIFQNEPFWSYQIKSKEPSPAFYGFVFIYTLIAFILIGPLVSWCRNKEENKPEMFELDGKQMEIEQRNGPEHQISSAGDHKQTAKESKEAGKDIYKNSDSSVHRKIHPNKKTRSDRSLLKNTQQRSLSSIGSNSDIRTLNSRYTTSKTVQSSASRRSTRSSAIRAVVLRELDQSYPDQDPDFQNRMALRFPIGDFPQHSFQSNIQNGNNNIADNRSGGGSNQPTETSSSIPSSQNPETSSSAPSAATTGRLYQNSAVNHNPSDKGFSKLVLDVGGRRWKNRRPIGRADVIENVVANNSVRQSPSINLNSMAKSKQSDANKMSTVPSNKDNSLKKGGAPNHLLGNSMSDLASSILSEQYHQLNHQPEMQIDISEMKKHQLEQLRLMHQFQMQQMQQQRQLFAMHRMQHQQRYYSHQRRFTRFGTRSVSEKSASVMSSIVDDISPDDAADANDPGRGNMFIQPGEKYWATGSQYGHHVVNDSSLEPEDCCLSSLESLLLLTVPDIEKRNVLRASIPLTLGASSEALFRLVTIAFISQYLGTKSMIAYLLVGLFMRLTSEELSSAIIDALSSFVQASMDKTSTDTIKSNYIAGQYIQLAFVLQVFLNTPLLVVWVIFMEQFVMWLVQDSTVALIALEYASIVVYAYMVQALSRTLTVVFHVCGHEHFESVIDLVASFLQVIAIACVVVFVNGAQLKTVAGIQVLINVASAIAKIAYPAARGWMKPFRKGMIQNVALWNYRIGLWHLFKAAAPLLLGTVLEYGEWELLTLFVHRLGPAEVATWTLLGAFWDFFEALTEGIGEAAANQVTYLLSAGQVEAAKKLSHGAILMAVTQAVLVTSVLYMSGQYLAILFTTDPAIQNMMNDSIILIGIANVIMCFSQITWSLIGAQGRFRLATFVIFFSRWLVTMPCALISIYIFDYDLNAVSGSLVVGYATACCALTVIVLSSDWDRLAHLMQVMNQPPIDHQLIEKNKAVDGDIVADDPILGLVDLENFDDSDDDSDGFGFGDYADGDVNENAEHSNGL